MPWGKRGQVRTYMQPVHETVYRSTKYGLYADGSCSQWDDNQQIWLESSRQVYITTDPKFGDNGLFVLDDPVDALTDPDMMVCFDEWLKGKHPVDYVSTRDGMEYEFVNQVERAVWDADRLQWVPTND